ncbi:MAG: methylated-DNA--[protein]-cysteine S-methyltransferase [Bacteroidota bacterium]
MNLFYDRLDSPIGALTIEADEDVVLKILFDWDEVEIRPNAVTDQCKTQLEEYFNGVRTEFDVPLRFNGTAFQEQVWNALLPVPFGETATYGEQAKKINNPKAVRAVGAANGQNVLNIIVPCHRIIGSNGSLTGYGGGMERKRWLLVHEQRVAGKTLL